MADTDFATVDGGWINVELRHERVELMVSFGGAPDGESVTLTLAEIERLQKLLEKSATKLRGEHG